jgi:hypothetical protein
MMLVVGLLLHVLIFTWQSIPQCYCFSTAIVWRALSQLRLVWFPACVSLILLHIWCVLVCSNIHLLFPSPETLDLSNNTLIGQIPTEIALLSNMCESCCSLLVCVNTNAFQIFLIGTISLASGIGTLQWYLDWSNSNRVSFVDKFEWVVQCCCLIQWIFLQVCSNIILVMYLHSVVGSQQQYFYWWIHLSQLY